MIVRLIFKCVRNRKKKTILNFHKNYKFSKKKMKFFVHWRRGRSVARRCVQLVKRLVRLLIVYICTKIYTKNNFLDSKKTAGFGTENCVVKEVDCRKPQLSSLGSLEREPLRSLNVLLLHFNFTAISFECIEQSLLFPIRKISIGAIYRE